MLAVVQATRPDVSPAERAFMSEMKDMENYADRQQVRWRIRLRALSCGFAVVAIKNVACCLVGGVINSGPCYVVAASLVDALFWALCPRKQAMPARARSFGRRRASFEARFHQPPLVPPALPVSSPSTHTPKFHPPTTCTASDLTLLNHARQPKNR